MKQVVQAVNGGPVRVVDVPRPTIGPTEVLVRTVSTTISPGTEGAVTALARASLLDKARARPDLVKQVLRKARTEGVAATAGAVRSRLAEDMPLGYSGAGVAVEVGAAVAGVVPGALVATGGAGWANHAEFQAVPGLLCVPVPAGVAPADASVATIASIALHGIRLGDVQPGSKVVVVGLGFVGQLALRLALAAGADVFGVDLGPDAVDRARAAGAAGGVEAGDATTDAVAAWSRSRGADAVIVCAADASSGIMARVPALCRDRATVVVVGDVGLHLDRRPFYDRELSVRFARSYGPGRYERSYEEWGVDLPPGHVRFTEGRNMETVLDLLASSRLHVDDLVTHRFSIDDAAGAYALVEQRREPFVGLQISYPDAAAATPPRDTVTVHLARRSEGPGVGLVGAGAFAAGVLVPALRRAGFDRLVAVASASGLSARNLADRAGFEHAVTGAHGVIDHEHVDVVVIATPHATHAELVVAALEAGKHVFCEKPLALTHAELDAVEDALARSAGVLFVGFNRRWSRPIAMTREHFGVGGDPLVIDYRVSAGTLPPSHWYRDRRHGGRLLGEVCHFVDTCSALAGGPAVSVHAVTSARPGTELALGDDVALLLRYADGSLATISYASGGHASTPKERIEVLGRGHSVVIDDFRSVVIDGSTTHVRPQDKGHDAEARAFFDAVRSGRRPDPSAVESTRTTLAALAALGTDS